MMGFNTTIVVLNDRLSEIERDPEFGKKLATAIRYFGRRDPGRIPYITGQTQVIEVAHADNLQVIAVGGNTGRVVGYGAIGDDDDKLIKGLERRRREKVRAAKAAPQ
jgi:hypothetical protein